MRYVDMNLQGLSLDQAIYLHLAGMWSILLEICWSSPDQHWGGWSTVNLEVVICSGEGGQLTVISGSICREVEICRWGGRGGQGRWVNWQSTWEGSAKTLKGFPLTMLILWGRVNWQSTWEGSAKTLEGLPLTMLILGEQQSTPKSADPLWVDCQSNFRPGSTLSEVILPKSLQILPKLIVNQP